MGKICVTFDVESTGLDRKKDHIIQLSMVKFDLDTFDTIEEFNTYVRPTGEYKISLGGYLKHRIDNETLKDAPTMEEIAPNVVEFFKGIDAVLGYNVIGFDIPMLKKELNEFGYDINFMLIDVYDSFLEERRRNGISLENTFLRYHGKTMVEDGLTAHDALSDVKATIKVFEAQQKKESFGPEKMYSEENYITDMDYNGKMVPCFSVGKYRGVPVELIAKVDQDYLKWCCYTSDLMESTKDFLSKYLKEYLAVKVAKSLSNDILNHESTKRVFIGADGN